MPVIKFNGQLFALQPGQNRLGGGTTADVAIGSADLGIQAIVDLGADNRATIRNSGANSTLKVNGTSLGGPTPLIHGDKVEIAGQELFFADDAKVGATQFVSASDVAAIAAKRSGPSRATASTGGRLVSLVDGKEYAIPEAGAIIGRDASADIVVAQTSVSRRHAQVIPSATGYVVNDLSTNGIFVNGEKVNASQPLSRSDVIRVGPEEFRFYADVAPAGGAAAKPTTPAAPSPAVQPPAPAPAPPPVAAKPAPAPVSPPTPPARPAAPPPAPKPVAPPPPAAAAPRPAPAPQAPAPKPAPPVAPAPSHAKTAPPAPPVVPAPAKVEEPAMPAPAPSEKKIPMWVGLVAIVLVAAVAAYFILQR